MNCGRRAVFAAGKLAPGGLVEIGVESGENDGPIGQLCDRRKQFRGCRHRTGRARGNHGLVGAGETFCLGIDEKVAPPRGVDHALFGEAFRPIAARDLEEVECELPVFVELVRHKTVELFPVHLAGNSVVDEAREIVSQSKRGSRRIGDQRRTLVGPDRSGPAHDELCQQQPPLERTNCRRQRQGSFSKVPVGLREDNLVLVEIAERDDARQDGRLIECARESIARHAACSPRGKVECCPRQFERTIGRRKTRAPVFPYAGS